MCELCDEIGDIVSCQDCGCLICYDVESGDDVMRRPYITESGDLFCNKCGPAYDQY